MKRALELPDPPMSVPFRPHKYSACPSVAVMYLLFSVRLTHSALPAAEYERQEVERYNKALEAVKREMEQISTRHSNLQAEFGALQREISMRSG